MKLNRKPVISGLLESATWAFIQSWGSKALGLLIYLILARLLEPQQLGVAAAVTLVLGLASLLSEFGFGEAAIQKQDLDPSDLNMPFLMSMTMSLIFVGSVQLFSEALGRVLGVPGLGPYLRVASFAAPIMTAAAFQEALYKRDMEFRALAARSLFAIMLSGVVGIGAAVLGYGVWSLIAQQMTFSVVAAIWLWSQPKWLPKLILNRASFVSLSRFGISVVGARLADFAATRCIEFLILTLHGPAALGLYSVGSKIYQTAIELLSRGVTDVALSGLSRLSDDLGKVARTYLNVVSLASSCAVPIFIGAALFSKEITVVIFGSRWIESSRIMMPLMLIGSIQSVQFVNGAIFSAKGRPQITLALTLLKCLIVPGSMLLLSSKGVGGLAEVYAAGSLVITPLSFWAITALLNLGKLEILERLLPAYINACLAAATVITMQNLIDVGALHGIVVLFGSIMQYLAVYLILTWMFNRDRILNSFSALRAHR